MKTKLLTAFLFLTVASAQVLAARPSINELNTRVNKLEADVNQLDSRVTTNESDINANSALIGDNANRIDALPKTIVVLDSNDKRVGIASSREDATDADVFFDVNGRLITLTVGKERFVQGPVEYDQPGCLGTPHVLVPSEWMTEPAFVRGTSVFGPIENTTPPSILRSQWRTDSGAEDGICVNAIRTNPVEYLPAEVIFDVSEFTPPFRYSVAP